MLRTLPWAAAGISKPTGLHLIHSLCSLSFAPQCYGDQDHADQPQVVTDSDILDSLNIDNRPGDHVENEQQLDDGQDEGYTPVFFQDIEQGNRYHKEVGEVKGKVIIPPGPFDGAQKGNRLDAYPGTVPPAV